uniref:Uncharacterized protein n=1 Tax=Avena sativa TaxID=4498 RepID=A0ACD5VG79_AVESA
MLSQRKTGDEVVEKMHGDDTRSPPAPCDMCLAGVVDFGWFGCRRSGPSWCSRSGNKDSKFKQEQNCGCGGGDDGASVEIAGDDESKVDAAPYKLRRRNSATMRAQFINTKELRICIGTYNVAGKAPPEGLDIAEWLGTGHKEADMYVLGFQEVVPLNAGIVIGAEDGQTALAWEELIRDTLTQQRTLLKTMSTTDRIRLAWPEKPLDLLAMTTASSSVKSSRSFSAPSADDDNVPDLGLDLDGALAPGGKKKGGRSPFVRIVSKQMVGIFLTIWVRRRLRRQVQNVKVSTVGVGKTGYVGNKGAVSVSMSVYETMFCFVCSHLAAGERPANLLKRNTDVQEIHRRTRFAGPGGLELPRDIYDHERIFWLGDLNYRIDIPYDRAHNLVAHNLSWPRKIS